MLIHNVLFLSTDALEYDKAGMTFYVDASQLGAGINNYKEKRQLFLQSLNKETRLVLTNPRTTNSMEFDVEAIDEYEGEVHGIRFVNENKTLKVVIFND